MALEGFGSAGSFGFGQTVYRVDRLDAGSAGSGTSGSLAYCMAGSNRFIVFEVSGTINLAGSYLYFNAVSNITLAGQTAPAPGIQIIGTGIWFTNDAHDILVQHLRIRCGDEIGSQLASQASSLRMSTSVYNIIIDHCSLEWGIDSNAEHWCHDSYNIVFSNCIFAECLHDSTYTTPASKNIGIGDKIAAGPIQVSLIKNLWCTVADRTPELRGDSETEMINNLFYNTRNAPTHITDSESTGNQLVSFVGNYRIEGGTLDTYSTHKLGRIASSVLAGTRIYYSDNICTDGDGAAAWENLAGGNVTFSASRTTGPWSGLVTVWSGANTKANVIANVGAWPAYRDTNDTRIIAYVNAAGARDYVDSPNGVFHLDYTGVAATVVITITDTTLTLNSADDGEDHSIDLTHADYDHVDEVIAAIDGYANYDCREVNNLVATAVATISPTLTDVSNVNVKPTNQHGIVLKIPGGYEAYAEKTRGLGSIPESEQGQKDWAAFYSRVVEKGIVNALFL